MIKCYYDNHYSCDDADDDDNYIDFTDDDEDDGRDEYAQKHKNMTNFVYLFLLLADFEMESTGK